MSADSKTRATVTTPNDTDIVISREFDAPRHLVFEAMTSAEHVKRWWGLRSWTNHISEVDLRVGGTWRFGQRGPDGDEVIFAGEYKEIEEPARLVYTERWENMPGGGSEDSVITATFDERDGKTTVTSVCRYDSKETRDAVIESGMESGLQETYDRLDVLLTELS